MSDVFEAVETLAIFPETAAIVPEMNATRIREVFVHRYRIVYEFDAERVLIVACIHSAREIGDVLRSRIP